VVIEPPALSLAYSGNKLPRKPGTSGESADGQRRLHFLTAAVWATALHPISTVVIKLLMIAAQLESLVE